MPHGQRDITCQFPGLLQRTRVLLRVDQRSVVGHEPRSCKWRDVMMNCEWTETLKCVLNELFVGPKTWKRISILAISGFQFMSKIESVALSHFILKHTL